MLGHYCQVDHSVLEALPAELREQVELSWTRRERRASNTLHHAAGPSSPPLRGPGSPTGLISLSARPAGTLLLEIPNQPGQSGSTGIVLELPDFSQVILLHFFCKPRLLRSGFEIFMHSRTADLRTPTLLLFVTIKTFLIGAI